MSVEHEDPFVKIAALIGGDEYLKVARSLLTQRMPLMKKLQAQLDLESI